MYKVTLNYNNDIGSSYEIELDAIPVRLIITDQNGSVLHLCWMCRGKSILQNTCKRPRTKINKTKMERI